MNEERAAVLERLDRLRDSKRADRVYQYVDSAHGSPVSVTDLLSVLRADDGLALELRASTGRSVICAVGIEDGRVAYPVWHHSAAAAKAGYKDVQVRSVDRRHEVAETLEDRYPIVRLRSETPLADLSGYGLDDRRVLADGGVDQSTDGIEHEGPRLTLGQIDQLPRWATCCNDCGLVYAESVPCPVCSLWADTEEGSGR